MKKFDLVSPFKPRGDQPKAIKEINLKLKKQKEITLLGATGTGKTFTIANVIAKQNKQTLVLAHNKTLAAQLYLELKELFPNNQVEYFISNFDFYQPEAYIPSSDTYIEKHSQINMELEMMRLSAMNSLLTKNDTIVVASVACIFALSAPKKYESFFLVLKKDEKIKRSKILSFLVKRGYKRTISEFGIGQFRVKGDIIEIFPGWNKSYIIQLDLFNEKINSITLIHPTTRAIKERVLQFPLFPANGMVTEQSIIDDACLQIKEDLKKRLKELKDKPIEHQRLKQRVNFDIEQLSEYGMCNGIENYTRYLDQRKPGETPYSLIDYFRKDFITIIDESHITIPQLKGMYLGDRSRKESLVKYGFRLPSALDNRPLKQEEFFKKTNKIIYVSATPSDYELEKDPKPVEQIVRPTGLLDPKIEIRSSKNQVSNIIDEIQDLSSINKRSMVLTLTVKMAEELTKYLKEKKIKVAYIHHELKPLERQEVIRKLRLGLYDCIVGINLLKEGIDIPEVSTIFILDADQEGFLRNTRSLIQIIGRASRNKDGKAVLYADNLTKSIRETLEETTRRRNIQKRFNKKHKIIPQTIIKKIPEKVSNYDKIDKMDLELEKKGFIKNFESKKSLIEKLEKEMLLAAKELNFETAAEIKNTIIKLGG